MNSKLFAAVCVLSMVACGDSGTGAGGSGGTGTSSSKSSSTGSKMATVSNSASSGTGGAGADGTSGQECMADSTCDTSGNGTSHCSTGLTNGSIYPDPVCVQLDPCDLGDGTTVESCDGDTGVCLDVGNTDNTGLCLGFCQFDDTGAAATGNCPGKDACNPYGFGQDPNMNNASFGVGYCFGGCLKDADCMITGEVCDEIIGQCVLAANVTTTTKNAGDACTGTDDTSCNCGIANGATGGMCEQFCKVGDPDNTCPTGTECDADLPATGMVPFTKEPAEMAGNCAKICTADTDCPTLPTGFCYASAGHTNKTCHFVAAQ